MSFDVVPLFFGFSKGSVKPIFEKCLQISQKKMDSANGSNAYFETFL